nr:tyrosine-type recombinase/integrase [Clostridium folliculivorans]
MIMLWDTGKFIHPMYYLNKLKKLTKAANIEKNIRFHDLRHTNATLLLKQGVSMKVV